MNEPGALTGALAGVLAGGLASPAVEAQALHKVFVGGDGRELKVLGG